MKQETPDLEGVWSEYRASLTAFLRSKISNRDDVDDLLQEILLKTHKSIGRLDKAESLKSWLFQISNNTIIDFYRSKGRSDAVIPEDLWYENRDYDDTHVLEGCVAPFIEALPAEMRRLLTRVDLQDTSQKDYAEELGISYSTLKSQVQASRRYLHKLFNDCCDFSLDAQGNIADYHRKPNGCDGC
ncbi:RNA polymerase sigma factor SigZ [Ruegeria sp. AU67]|uniref:RNA polymerase sigma factor SigZ n=1 Tax=Ruegeria sp. AU67 TaxID=2108530 RepID=UPI000D68B28A|nr:RNA polymerase sigma factor SigZ [Ruegeria sp. AU67]